MSEPYVSSYDDVFTKAFTGAIENVPWGQAVLVKDIVDQIQEQVVSSIENYVLDDMKRNLDDQIRGAASEVARSMVMNALAGDDETIRNLFGFTGWYMKHAWPYSAMPTQWKLIDALVDRRPEIFLDERLAQRDREITQLKERVAQIGKTADHYRRLYEGSPDDE
jgi:hypothetical protein